MSKFMQDRLFNPLGMHSAVPRFDASGNFVGSSYVYATARDFARFGYLYMTDGMWNGSRLLPEGWVDYSRTPIARDPDNGLDYGAHVWMFPNDPGSIAALGYEGQFTWASPKRNLVVVRLGKTNADHAPSLRAELSKIVHAFPTQGSDIGNDGHYG
jgi:CubicO group peptidase (beta-lactamase class C family)